MWCVDMMSKVMSRVFYPFIQCVFIVHFVATVLIAALALASEPIFFSPDLIRTHAGQGIEI